MAIELGVSSATISRRLTTALQKLGLSSRADLLRALGR
jgi:DNA-binding NarL/FixJ family response regulator